MSTVVFILSGTTYSIPSTTTYKVEALGGGQGGQPLGSDGGIGGTYAAVVGESHNSGDSITVAVGAAGTGGVYGGAARTNGGNSSWQASPTVLARGGGQSTTNVGTTINAGGASGMAVGLAGPGGGGAGGGTGVGAAGGNATTAPGAGGKGDGSAGGNGGAINGGAGSAGTEWDGSHGSGGGGGGGAFAANGNGGAGGAYGGGGGAAGTITSCCCVPFAGVGGNGYQGLLVVTYTPAATATAATMMMMGV